MNIKTVKHNGLSWVNVYNPTNEEIEYLRKTYKFHPLDLKDCTSPAQRPNLDKYPDYIFMILLFPVFDKKNREVIPSEVDFFIGQDYLVMVHQNKLAPIVDLYELCLVNDHAREKYFGDGIEQLLYTMLNSLFLYCYPMLDHIGMDIDQIEKKIFAGQEKKMVKEILIIRRNITNFRKIMQTHKNVLKKLIDTRNANKHKLNGLRIYFEELIEDTKDIWDTLQGFKETIETIQITNESLISFRINDIVKTLTVISVLALPITVVASVFGMNAKHMPFIGNPNDFWILLLICGSFGAGMIWFFSRKGMLK
ncbi:magnesium transporter CorA family protein [Patescibacteria group bacterium]|nr:magnesium transporter CorA family protein [Patescibacteria group bacterium]MBU1889948.1 magnesium transporter CorA family protein [Patescibacteria group bacterium]